MTLSIPSARAAIAAATPGPWEADVWIETDGSGWRATGPHHESDDDASDEPGCPDEQAAQRDAQFIAAARTGWPEALNRIEALEAALAEACDLLHDIGSHDDEYGYAVDRAEKLRSLLAGKEP